jgi:hypothetical protein
MHRYAPVRPQITDAIAAPRVSLLRRLIEAFKELGVARRQRAAAQLEATALLRIARSAGVAPPSCPRRDFYRRIVAARLGCDEREARRIVREAEQSFACWPVFRDLTLRDIASYMIFTDWMGCRSMVPNAEAIREVVENVISSDL